MAPVSSVTLISAATTPGSNTNTRTARSLFKGLATRRQRQTDAAIRPCYRSSRNAAIHAVRNDGPGFPDGQSAPPWRRPAAAVHTIDGAKQCSTPYISQRRQCFGQALRHRGQFFTRSGLPGRIFKRPPRHNTRGMRNGPRPDHFAQRVKLSAAARMKPTRAPASPKNLPSERSTIRFGTSSLPANAATVFPVQHRQKLRRRSASATTPAQLVGGIKQCLTRRPAGRRIIRVAQQHGRRDDR